jgi:hypothetical protein
MALYRTITVLLKLPGNKTQTIAERVPAEWITGDKDAMSELLDNPQVRTRISVAADHVISVQITNPYDPHLQTRIVRG